MSSTARLEDDAANEIERLREEAGYAKLTYDKRMAEKLTRAEAKLEHAESVIKAALHDMKNDNDASAYEILKAYDKERDSG
jgi:hypothetical protein